MAPKEWPLWKGILAWSTGLRSFVGRSCKLAVPRASPPTAVFCSVHSDFHILWHFQTFKNQKISGLNNYFWLLLKYHRDSQKMNFVPMWQTWTWSSGHPPLEWNWDFYFTVVPYFIHFHCLPSLMAGMLLPLVCDQVINGNFQRVEIPNFYW